MPYIVANNHLAFQNFFIQQLIGYKFLGHKSEVVKWKLWLLCGTATFFTNMHHILQFVRVLTECCANYCTLEPQHVNYFFLLFLLLCSRYFNNQVVQILETY